MTVTFEVAIKKFTPFVLRCAWLNRMAQRLPMNEKQILISINGLTRSYHEGDRSRSVLRSLDLDIKRGECVALVGQSGSGKSTLLNLISGIDQPSAGDIRIDGVNLTRLNERDRTLFRRKHIGFVYQFFNLIPTLNVAENLLLPLELNRVDRHRALSASMELLQAVGLADRRETFPDRLSGGEQQRLAIARALVHDPLLVLADEPTGNLDAGTGSSVLQLLERLVRGAGKTLIIVTHSQQVTQIADRTLTLMGGKIATQTQEDA